MQHCGTNLLPTRCFDTGILLHCLKHHAVIKHPQTHGGFASKYRCSMSILTRMTCLDMNSFKMHLLCSRSHLLALP